MYFTNKMCGTTSADNEGVFRVDYTKLGSTPTERRFQDFAVHREVRLSACPKRGLPRVCCLQRVSPLFGQALKMATRTLLERLKLEI